MRGTRDKLLSLRKSVKLPKDRSRKANDLCLAICPAGIDARSTALPDCVIGSAHNGLCCSSMQLKKGGGGGCKIKNGKTCSRFMLCFSLLGYYTLASLHLCIDG